MKLTTSRRLLMSQVDCQKWARVILPVRDSDLKEKLQDRFSVTLGSADGQENQDLFDRATKELFAYHIYPPWRMRPTLCGSQGRIAKDGLIVQRILLGPLGVETAVRVVDVFDVEDKEKRSVGFIYATLPGHPERGEAKFKVSRYRSSGQVTFTIETCSSPGNWLSALVRPLTHFLQKRSNHEALVYFKRLVTNKV